MFSANTSQVSNDVKYIEDFFSAWLRTGTGSSQTVTTGIKENTGALVISKSRSAATDWAWYDTFRGATKDLASNTSAAETTQSQGLTAFNTDGHTWGTLTKVNTSGATYVDFVLKPTPKFFDVVTFTIDGASSNQQVAHNLGSTPGCIFVKASNAAGDWFVYHNATGNNNVLFLNGTQAASAETGAWSTSSTNFGIKSSALFGGGLTGKTAVAYLFAHNAGGFGLTGTDNVITCGSYTGNGSATGPSINLGFEPQWLLVKNASASGNYWHIVDNMRGWTDGGNEATLLANTADSENGLTGAANYSSPTSTGFKIESASSEVNTSGATYIYIAIRRGPMKTPTSGTSVFSPIVSTASTGTALTTGFPVDMQFPIALAPTYTIATAVDRLRGVSSTTTASGRYLEQSNTNAEASGTVTRNWGNTGFQFPDYFATLKTLFLNFQRAPGFMDVVCYTGDGTAGRDINHNLGVTPEMIVVKKRSSSTDSDWAVYHSGLSQPYYYIRLNLSNALLSDPQAFDSGNHTATTFSVGLNVRTNGSSGATYVAYLFASCPGVSKVGSYTGTGTTQQINCGFTAGARFVLIKRTDSTGDWYVWDSARGIVAGNDPYLLLNSTAAEVTTTDYVDTFSSGFEISSTAPAAINASGGTFIYLAIA